MIPHRTIFPMGVSKLSIGLSIYGSICLVVTKPPCNWPFFLANSHFHYCLGSERPDLRSKRPGWSVCRLVHPRYLFLASMGGFCATAPAELQKPFLSSGPGGADDL